MRKSLALFLTAATLTLPSLAMAGGALYGTVTTHDGQSYTGAIRWDKNENYWDDLLDAGKKDKVEVRRQSDGLDLKIFGVRINKSGRDDSNWTHSQFSIPMGHIASLEAGSGKEVHLTLKNGDALTIRQGADIGGSMRGIVIDDDTEGELELEWEDVAKVAFSETPESINRDAERLYGTVETRVGDFTGYIVWDRDESLQDDVIDGEEDGTKRKIAFRKIAGIEKLGGHGSLIVLKSGSEIELEGTNDVDSDNRGIDVTIQGLGKVSVPWREFERVTFRDPPASPAYASFDGGRAIRGTVTDRDGGTYSGLIVWDQDESYTWESLDGRMRQVDFSILFQHIARIERESRSAARVILTDGLELTLRGSNDVDDENKGIVVLSDDGQETVIAWEDFRDAILE